MPVSVIIPQCAAATNRTILSTTTVTASNQAGPFPVDFWSSAEIMVAVTTVSGTLDVYVQRLLPDNETYADIAHFAQWTTGAFTTTGAYTLSFVNGGNTINQQQAAGLAANSVITVHFGANWRINYVLGGTSPTVTFAVYGSFRS